MPGRTLTRVLLGVLGVVLLSACRLDVTVDLVIEGDGTGTLTVSATADADVVQRGPGLAGDLRFDDAVAAGWTVEGPTATDDGGLQVRLSHSVSSAAEATNLLASIGPPFSGVALGREVSADGKTATTTLLGELVLTGGFDAFADADLLAAVGGSPWAADLAETGATPSDSMSVVFRAALPGEVDDRSNGDVVAGVRQWDAPLDGSTSSVELQTVQRPSGGGFASVLSTSLLVLFVAWVAAACAFIVSVIRARAAARPAPPASPVPPALEAMMGGVGAAETEVAIVGAGPAGLVLAHLLQRLDIDCVVLEQRDREYVEHRVRAGVLEHPTVELLRSLGLADRLDREGLAHRGIELAFDGGRHRIDFLELTGRSITVYGQQEVVKDLIAARLGTGGAIEFEVTDVELIALDTERPTVRYRREDGRHELRCRVVAGCDGSHGVCAGWIPERTIAARTYPFAWLGILAQAAPSQDELVYARHDRGFALFSMRSPTVSRLYLQVAADESLDAWPDDRIWDELARRLPTTDGFVLNTGPLIEKGITEMHSSVASPMRHGRLLVAGDAAHIVPATGAKGMNLAIADAVVMADVIAEALRHDRPGRLADYTATCLGRVWRTQHFSHRMTTMLHRFGDDPFQAELQRAELALVTSSTAAATDLAEHYVGLPFTRLAA